MYKYIFLLITSIFLSTASPASASTGLSISPATIDLLIAPNKTVLQNIELTNLGDSTTYHVELRRLIPYGQDGGATVSSNSVDPSSLPLSFTLNNSPLSSFTLALNSEETTTLSLAISSATITDSREEYLALVFTPQSSTPLGAAATIALPILATITPSGDLGLDLKLTNFDLPIFADSLTTFTISPQLINSGHHMLRPTGQLVLSPPSGGDTTYPVSPNLILSGTTRNLYFEPKLSLKPALTRIDPHTFHLTITTAGGKIIAESTRTVWFLPIRLILVLIAGLIGGITLLTRSP